MAVVNAPKQAALVLRKVAATRAAENGATEFELMAIFGWTDPKIAAPYVKAVNRTRLPAQAKGSRTQPEHLFPHLHPMREPERKAT
jgi:hypothetical protein